jgi:predicted enzyme related to lactoylglutathione lyase
VGQAAVNMVHIHVADLDRAERFYTAIGVRFRRATYCTPNFLVSEGEGVQFEVHVRSEREGTEGLKLGFLIDDIDAILDSLPGLGGTIVGLAIADGPPMRSALLLDPDGHTVKLRSRKVHPRGMPDAEAGDEAGD